MNHVVCEHCSRQFPMNETVRLHGRLLCVPCAESALEGQQDVPEGAVEIQVDPTVCRNCGLDNGAAPLETFHGLPACNECLYIIRHRPFPGWVKASAVGLIALVLFAIYWNSRFFLAYGEMKASVRALGEGGFDEAADLMASAAERVPENPALRAFADFLRGIQLLQADQSAEALEYLEKCRGGVPADFHVEEAILQAKMGKCFDERDYDGFLGFAQEFDNRVPDDAMVRASVASAYACKYAVSGDEELRRKALEALDEAKGVADDDPELAKYENRILHRIATRKIIRREEFNRLYPEGWQPPDEKE